MPDLGKALLDKLDTVINTWVKAVRTDIEIDSSKGLTYEAVHNGLPHVLKSVAMLLTDSITDKVTDKVTDKDENEELEDEAQEHGAVRAAQGFDITEVVREYRILRNVLISTLEPELETGSATEALQAVRHIDTVLDDAVLTTIKSYMQHRLSVLEQMHGQLLLTNQELSRLVQSQKDSVSHLAHELKNPLNSIISFSTILLRKQRQQLTTDVKTPLEMQQMERILDNGRQLLRLINNTLEVARKESEQITLVPEVVPVASLIQAVIEALEPTVANKDIELAINCELAPETVVTDSLRLQQILTNLVSNAIRYTDRGNVTVASYKVEHEERDRPRWALVVCDTGKGMSEAVRSKIFQPYFQAGTADERLPDSSGLGLTIVSKLVKLLQGEIKIESTLGQGSTFTVLLPMELEVSADATSKADPTRTLESLGP